MNGMHVLDSSCAGRLSESILRATRYQSYAQRHNSHSHVKQLHHRTESSMYVADICVNYVKCWVQRLIQLYGFFVDCVNHQPKAETEFEELLRDHSNVYPTGDCFFLIHFLFALSSCVFLNNLPHTTRS